MGFQIGMTSSVSGAMQTKMTEFNYVQSQIYSVEKKKYNLRFSQFYFTMDVTVYYWISGKFVPEIP